MLTKLFGPSWQTTIGGNVVFIGGLGAIVSHTALGGTPVGLTIETISEVFALAGAAFGFTRAKAVNVTGLQTGNPATTTATSDPAKDGTAAPTPPVNTKP